MKINNILAIFAVIAIFLALFNISLTLIKVSDLKEKITGYATGLVNVTIVEEISLNMTNSSINWGQGRVDSGEYNATLYTVQDSTPVVLRGNWSSSTNNVAALRLENIGNVNVSLTLQAGLNAHGMFGSASSTHEMYQWNITEQYSNVCNGGNEPLNTWRDVNVSSAGKFCDDFNYEPNQNALYIDILMTIPWDSKNTSTEIADTITATGSAT